MKPNFAELDDEPEAIDAREQQAIDKCKELGVDDGQQVVKEARARREALGSLGACEIDHISFACD
jgi:hypothetical protein